MDNQSEVEFSVRESDDFGTPCLKVEATGMPYSSLTWTTEKLGHMDIHVKLTIGNSNLDAIRYAQSAIIRMHGELVSVGMDGLELIVTRGILTTEMSITMSVAAWFNSDVTYTIQRIIIDHAIVVEVNRG